MIAVASIVEAWFIAAAKSLHGQRGFSFDPAEDERDAEGPRNAKGWIGKRMAGGTYREITDQPAKDRVWPSATRRSHQLSCTRCPQGTFLRPLTSQITGCWDQTPGTHHRHR